MRVEVLCLSEPGSGEDSLFFFLLPTWPPSSQYGKGNSCQSVGIDTDGGPVSAACAVPALPVTPRYCRGAFAPGPQREEPAGTVCPESPPDLYCLAFYSRPGAPPEASLSAFHSVHLLWLFSARTRTYPWLEGSVEAGTVLAPREMVGT